MAGQGTKSLSELAAIVHAEVDTFALTVGNLMLAARERAPSRFERWVREDTPFTVAEALRLVHVALAYRDLPSQTVVSLPRPSSALSYVFEEADTAPYLSPTNRFSREDLAAGALLGGDPAALSVDVRSQLEQWLADAHDPHAIEPPPPPPSPNQTPTL